MVAQTTGVVSALESWRSYLLGPLHMSAVKQAARLLEPIEISAWFPRRKKAKDRGDELWWEI